MSPPGKARNVFLSTLSLRRATGHRAGRDRYQNYFYPRSPCGERPQLAASQAAQNDFYPRSPCGERPDTRLSTSSGVNISIHALLAESDGYKSERYRQGLYFYPRSPCGERRHRFWHFCVFTGISIHALLAESDPAAMAVNTVIRAFLSTLSLRRATKSWNRYTLCKSFLSTLSLRRATGLTVQSGAEMYFYPRSPCGERLHHGIPYQVHLYHISIHALLAESDP